MTAQALEEALDRTDDFLTRQRLLKQLWRMRERLEVRDSEAQSTGKRLSNATEPKQPLVQQVA